MASATLEAPLLKVLTPTRPYPTTPTTSYSRNHMQGASTPASSPPPPHIPRSHAGDALEGIGGAFIRYGVIAAARSTSGASAAPRRC